MFIWKTSSILGNIRTHMPDLYEGLQPIVAAYGTAGFDAALQDNFCKLPAESIDFGIMEKAQSIYTIPGNFGWDDVGSWLALERINPTNEFGNMVEGDVISIDTRRSTIIGGNKLIATVGIEDIVIVDTEDALLVVDRERCQDVRKVVDELKALAKPRLI